MVSLFQVTGLLALGYTALVNAAVLPKRSDPTDLDSSSNSTPFLQSTSTSEPEPRWGQAMVHLPSHKVAVFLGGRSRNGSLIHGADILNVSALQEGANIAHAWSTLTMSKNVPASTFATAATLPSQNRTSFVLIGGETVTCEAAPAYIWTSESSSMLHGSWSALQAHSSAYERAHVQAMRVVNTTNSEHAILVAGQAQARAGCPSVNVTRSNKSSLATTEKWIYLSRPEGTSQATMAVDVTPAPRHFRHNVPVRDYAAVAVEGKGNATDKILYIGGLTSDKKLISLRHLWSLDVASGGWSRVKTRGATLGGLYGHSATLMPGNKIVVVGGYQGTGSNRTISSETFVLDLNQSPPTWSSQSSAKAPGRVFHSAFNVGHKLIVAFGKIDHDSHSGKRAGNNDNVLFLDTRTWTWSATFHGHNAVAAKSSSTSAALQHPSSTQSALSAQSPASTQSASFPERASSIECTTSAKRASTTPSHQSKSTSASSGAHVLSSVYSLGPRVGSGSTPTPSDASRPTSGLTLGNPANNAASSGNDGGNGMSGRTLAAILAPTLSVAFAIILWLIFALCLWRYCHRRSRNVKEGKGILDVPRRSRIMSTARGIPHQSVRRPIDSSSTVQSHDMTKEEPIVPLSMNSHSAAWSQSYYPGHSATPMEPKPALLVRDAYSPPASSAHSSGPVGAFSGGFNAISCSLRSSLKMSPRSTSASPEEDKYTPVRTKSMRNLRNFRGRASIRRERETARYNAAVAAMATPTAPSEEAAHQPAEVTYPQIAMAAESPFHIPRTAQEEYSEEFRGETAWLAPPQSAQIEPSSSDVSAVSYPYLQGVPRTSVSSSAVPEPVVRAEVSPKRDSRIVEEMAVPRSAQIKRKSVPSLCKVEVNPKGFDVLAIVEEAAIHGGPHEQGRSTLSECQDTESLQRQGKRRPSGWFNLLVDQENSSESSHMSDLCQPMPGALHIPRTPAGSVGQESLVDPFTLTEAHSNRGTLPAWLQCADSVAEPEPYSPSDASSPSPVTMHSARSLSQPTPRLRNRASQEVEQPAGVVTADTVTELSPAKLPEWHGLAVQRGPCRTSAYPLPQAPGAQDRTPSAYAGLYPSPPSEPVSLAPGSSEASASSPLPPAVARTLPTFIEEPRPRTFHESSTHAMPMQMSMPFLDQRPVSFHGSSAASPAVRRPNTGSQRNPSAPYARMMLTPANVGTPAVPRQTGSGLSSRRQSIEWASTSQLHLVPPLPGSRRPTSSQLYPPSFGSRASSPTPSEQMFAPEGAHGVPPAYLL